MKKADIFVMRVIKTAAIIIYTVLLVLITLPFLKGEILEYKLSNRTYEISSTPLESVGSSEPVIPPKLSDVLAFNTPNEKGIIGEVYYPRLAINLPIYTEVTNENLMGGVISLTPERDPLTENIAITGHNFGYSHVLLSDLLKSNIGDTMSINMLNHYYTYKVVKIDVIHETDISVLENSKGDKGMLTLLTCDQGDITDKRFVVVGELVKDSSKQTIDVAKVSSLKTKLTQKKVYKIILIFLVSLIVGYYIINRIIRK